MDYMASTKAIKTIFTHKNSLPYSRGIDIAESVNVDYFYKKQSSVSLANLYCMVIAYCCN